MERTVPFVFLVQSLTIIWYAARGRSPADVDARKIACPWYGAKTESALSDMPGKLRQALVFHEACLLSGAPERKNAPELG